MATAERKPPVVPPSTHTPGPWAWFGNTKNRDIYLATPHSGRTLVMSFVRWGMADATPCFYAGGVRRPAAEFVRYEVDYRDDIATIDHPDARLIAAAPVMLAKLKEIFAEQACTCRLQPLVDGPVPCKRCQLGAVISNAEGRS